MTVNDWVLTSLLCSLFQFSYSRVCQGKQVNAANIAETLVSNNFFYKLQVSSKPKPAVCTTGFFFYLGRLLYHKLGVSLVTLDFRENSVAIRGIRGKTVLDNWNKIYCDLPVCSVALSLFYLLQNYNLKNWLHPTLTAVIEFFFVLSKNLKCFNSTKKIIYRIVLHFHELFN